MKVSVVRGGGIAGLVTTTTVDVADLAAPDAARLREAVQRARTAGPAAPAPSGPDRFSYEVTVEDGGVATDLSAGGMTGALRELVALVQGSPARRSAHAPPGG